MAETYKKVGDDLEVTNSQVKIVTELALLKKKKSLQEDRVQREHEIERIDVEIESLDEKLKVVRSE